MLFDNADVVLADELDLDTVSVWILVAGLVDGRTAAMAQTRQRESQSVALNLKFAEEMYSVVEGLVQHFLLGV